MPSVGEMIGNFVLGFFAGIDKIIKYNHFSVVEWIFICVWDTGFTSHFQDGIPNFFRNGIHQLFEFRQFILVKIGGKDVNFVVKNKRRSEKMHQGICFSTSRLSSNEHAKIFIKAEIIQSSFCGGRFAICVIIWYFHFLFGDNELIFKISLFLALKMDLENIKKYAQSEMAGFQMKKAVTAVKNEIKDAEKGRDIVMSDYFKPLIDQQKKSDEKQDKVIEQLNDNQDKIVKALENNPQKAISYSGEPLPELEGDEPKITEIEEEDEEEAPSTSKTTKKVSYVDLDKGISVA